MWVAARKVDGIDLQIPWTTQGQVINYAAGMLNEGLSPAMARCYLSQMKAMHIAKGKPFLEAHLVVRIINGRDNKKEEGRKRMAVSLTMMRHLRRAEGGGNRQVAFTSLTRLRSGAWLPSCSMGRSGSRSCWQRNPPPLSGTRPCSAKGL